MDDPRDTTQPKKTHPHRPFTWNIFTSLIIDSHEGRDMVIFDVPGAYLNADMPEDKLILLKIEG